VPSEATLWTVTITSAALFVILFIIGTRHNENIVSRHARVWGIACALLVAVAFISLIAAFVTSRKSSA
jgi:cytochrome c biogenesis factor